jgi:hypothetical protein
VCLTVMAAAGAGQALTADGARPVGDRATLGCGGLALSGYNVCFVGQQDTDMTLFEHTSCPFTPKNTAVNDCY